MAESAVAHDVHGHRAFESGGAGDRRGAGEGFERFGVGEAGPVIADLAEGLSDDRVARWQESDHSLTCSHRLVKIRGPTRVAEPGTQAVTQVQLDRGADPISDNSDRRGLVCGCDGLVQVGGGPGRLEPSVCGRTPRQPTCSSGRPTWPSSTRRSRRLSGKCRSKYSEELPRSSRVEPQATSVEPMAAAPRAGFRKDASREQRRRSGSVTAAAIVYLDCAPSAPPCARHVLLLSLTHPHLVRAYDAASGTVRCANRPPAPAGGRRAVHGG